MWVRFCAFPKSWCLDCCCPWPVILRPFRLSILDCRRNGFVFKFVSTWRLFRLGIVGGENWEREHFHLFYLSKILYVEVAFFTQKSLLSF